MDEKRLEHDHRHIQMVKIQQIRFAQMRSSLDEGNPLVSWHDALIFLDWDRTEGRHMGRNSFRCKSIPKGQRTLGKSQTGFFIACSIGTFQSWIEIQSWSKCRCTILVIIETTFTSALMNWIRVNPMDHRWLTEKPEKCPEYCRRHVEMKFINESALKMRKDWRAVSNKKPMGFS